VPNGDIVAPQVWLIDIQHIIWNIFQFIFVFLGSIWSTVETLEEQGGDEVSKQASHND